jgi:DNA-directed RNA polymerase subunit RPC12/RpoP
MLFGMSRNEFISATKDHNKHGVAFVGILLLFVFISLVGYLPFEKPFQRYLASRFSESSSNALATVPLFLPTLLFFAIGTAFGVRRERKFRIQCPHCGKNLTCTAIYQGIVIASKNCPYCGLKVLDEKS